MKLIIRGAIFIAAIFVTDWLLPGIAIKTLEAGLLVALFLVIINTFIKPIIRLFTFPITMLSLGFFPLVLNTIFILLIAYFVDGFAIFAGDYLFLFLRALLFSLLLTIVNFALERLSKLVI